MTAQANILFERELWETIVTLRGTVAPADYKHYIPLYIYTGSNLRTDQVAGMTNLFSQSGLRN